MELEYRKCGDYYLPNIVIPEESKETKGKHIGKYGVFDKLKVDQKITIL